MAFLWLLSCFALIIGMTCGGGAPASEPELSVIPRIIYGWDANPGSWPSFVTVTSATGKQFCGGVLIDRKWVITSAHCNVTSSDRVVAGLYNRKSHRNIIQTVRVDKVFLHPDFNWSTLDNDICLLRLARPVRLTRTVSPVVLPGASENLFVGTLCYIMGWGDTHPNETKIPDKLQEVILPLLSKDECIKQWGTLITDAKFCAGAGGAYCWDGDGGNPLICYKNGVFVLMGILSFMSEFCPTQTPMVFTQVNTYIPWIEKTLATN